MNIHTSKRLWLAYLDIGLVQTSECVVEADSVSEAISEAELIFKKDYPVIEQGGFGISVEKAVGCSDTVEPDYHGITK